MLTNLQCVGVELVLLSRVAYGDREISGARLRGLLALLAWDLRAGIGTSRLIDALWPDERPENPAKALQIVVSRARTQFGSDLIARTSTGYRLMLPAEHVDASAVLLAESASTQHARAGDHAAALADAEAGLALWDGAPADESDPHDPLDALRAERAATYRSLARTRALSLARLARRCRPSTSGCCGPPRPRSGTASSTSRTRCWAATATSLRSAACSGPPGWSRSSEPAAWARRGWRRR
jgi:hypothetical protein